MPATKGQKRDVTEALELLKQAGTIEMNYGGAKNVVVGRTLAVFSYDRLTKILKDIDARTGRRDPSKRKQPARTRR
jgi:hypothetical protein